MQYKPSEVIDLLTIAIKGRKPVLITGSAGIGKSDCVAEATRRAGYNLMLSHPVVQDPTAFGGIPWPRPETEEVKMLPYGRLAEALRATEPTVWDMEDLGHAMGGTQASCMQLLLSGELEGHKIPDCVTFVATTNPRKAGYGVQGILEPVKGRFTIVEMIPDLNDFCNYCTDHNQPPVGQAFLRYRPELLCKDYVNPDMTNQPNPRNWINAFWWLEQGAPPQIERAGIEGRVGEGAATEFIAYKRMAEELPHPDSIVLDPDHAKIPKEPSALYAVASALSRKATSRNFDRIVRYLQRMYDDAAGEFAVLAIRDATRRTPSVMQTAAYTQVASTPLGQLFTGED